jgi:hypothetical protein
MQTGKGRYRETKYEDTIPNDAFQEYRGHPRSEELKT